jgi:CheY-like chemotaxis protein
VAEDGLQAVELAGRLQPDLVLMDIQLPRLDGLEATRRLQQDPRTHAIPVIALTANAMAEDRKRVLEAGCIGHIAKPIDTSGLTAQIRAMLAARRPRRAA